MLSETRLEKIAGLVEKKGSVTVQELMGTLNASESTIRRDLNALHNQKRLVKVHGGAVARGNSYQTRDDELKVRKDLNQEEKMRIAKYAASLIVPGDFIYLDAGSTVEFMIEFMAERNITVVTNALLHVRKLADARIPVYVLGGEYKKSTEAVVGEEALSSLSKYNFTKGFFGANGITKTAGFTTPEIKEAMVKKKAMEQCRECYVLGDSSKFNQISSVTFGGFEKGKVITTQRIGKQYKNQGNIIEVP